MVRMKGRGIVVLERIEKLEALIRCKLAERQQWQERAKRVSDTRAVERCADMEAQINALVERLEAEQKKITEILERLDSPMEYTVLHMRYVRFMSLQQIADHFGKNYSWVTTTHGRAVRNVEKLMVTPDRES